MASLFTRVARFAQSPQGKEFAGKAERFARDPQNRRRLEQLKEKLAKRRKP
jgi:hypothetical protein